MNCNTDSNNENILEEENDSNNIITSNDYSNQQCASSSRNCDHNDYSNNQDENEDNLQEQQHFFDIINTFRYYKNVSFKKINKRINFIERMSKEHQKKLVNYRLHLDKLQLAVSHNYEVIKVIIADAAKMFKNTIYLQNKQNSLVVKSENELDTSRIDSILNQIVREWCSEGSNERSTCFDLILNELEEHFPILEDRKYINVLVPGAGLGRLPYEIASRGFSCQGNEYSLMMLIVANFILNKCNESNLLTIYPWVSHFSNNFYSDHQIVNVTFPDIDPTCIPRDVNFSMVAGSFTEIYNHQSDMGSFDCIATCFFLDTAQNVVAYIETIYKLLKPDGLWINFGPLLYHYADMPDSSIEPSYEIVRQLIESYGFKFLKEESNIPSYYTRNPNSMVSFQYKCIFFKCQK